MTLLVIGEDDDDFRWLLKTTLERSGFEVRCAARGDELVALVQAIDPPPDLILSDVRMPGMPGTEVVGALRRAGSSVPIVLMTAFEEAVSAEEAQALGAERLLSKPFDLAELRAVLGDLVPTPGPAPRNR